MILIYNFFVDLRDTLTNMFPHFVIGAIDLSRISHNASFITRNVHMYAPLWDLRDGSIS